MRRFISSLALSILTCLTASAQENTVSLEANSRRIGDNVRRIEMTFSSPGEGGRGMVWDFSRCGTTGKKYTDVFYCDSDSVLTYGLEIDVINKYRIAGDSLLLVGYENPMTSVDYLNPLLVMLYPSSYGMVFGCDYTGAGTYCKKLEVETGGTLQSEIDGEGVLVLNEGDTIRNVLRLHSVNSGYSALHNPSDSLRGNERTLRQEITERHLWYARGYRYPLYETVTTTTYADLSPVSVRQTAYCRPPEDMRIIRDEVNEQIALQDSLMSSSPPDIIHYSVEVEGRTVRLHYSLDEAASIRTLLCNSMGMLYHQTTSNQPAGSGYSLSFDCAGLQRGSYVLYVNVNGKVYNETIYLE